MVDSARNFRDFPIVEHDDVDEAIEQVSDYDLRHRLTKITRDVTGLLKADQPRRAIQSRSCRSGVQ